RVVARQLALGTALLAQELLGALAIVPEVGIGGLLVELRDPLAHPSEVKAAPGARPSARAAPQNARTARDRWGPAPSPRSWSVEHSSSVWPAHPIEALVRPDHHALPDVPPVILREVFGVFISIDREHDNSCIHTMLYSIAQSELDTLRVTHAAC